MKIKKHLFSFFTKYTIIVFLAFFSIFTFASCYSGPHWIKPTSIQIISPSDDERISYIDEDAFFSDFNLSVSVEPKNADNQVIWSIEDFVSYDNSTIDIVNNKIHFANFHKKQEVNFTLKASSKIAPEIFSTKKMKLLVKELPTSVSLSYVDNDGKIVLRDLQAFFDEETHFDGHLKATFFPTDAYDKIDFKIDQQHFPSRVHIDGGKNIFVESLSDHSKTDKYNFTISCFSCVSESIVSLPLEFSCNFVSHPQNILITYESGVTNMQGFSGDEIDFPGLISTEVFPNDAPQETLLQVVRTDKQEGTIEIGEDKKIHCSGFDSPANISFKIKAQSKIDPSVDIVCSTDFNVQFIRKPTEIKLNYIGNNSATTYQNQEGSFDGTLSARVYPEDADQSVVYSITNKDPDFDDSEGQIEIKDNKINFKNFKEAKIYKFKVQAKSTILDEIIGITDVEFTLTVQQAPDSINITFSDEFGNSLGFEQDIYASTARAHIFGFLSANVSPETSPQDAEWSIVDFQPEGNEKIELVKNGNGKVEIYYSGFSYNSTNVSGNSFDLKIRATSSYFPSIFYDQTFKINIIETPVGDLPKNIYIVNDQKVLTGLRVSFSDDNTKEIYKNCSNMVLPEEISDINYIFSSNMLNSIINIDMSSCKNLTFTVDTPSMIFSGCDTIQMVKFSNSTTIIPPYMFSNCKSLQRIVFPHNTKVSYSISEGAFSNDTSIEEILLHNISVISKNAFSSCSGIYKAIFGCSEISSLSSLLIGSTAFQQCSHMSTLLFYLNKNTNKNILTISQDAFDGLPENGNVKNMCVDSEYTSSQLLNDLIDLTKKEGSDSPFKSWGTN